MTGDGSLTTCEIYHLNPQSDSQYGTNLPVGSIPQLIVARSQDYIMVVMILDGHGCPQLCQFRMGCRIVYMSDPRGNVLGRKIMHAHNTVCTIIVCNGNITHTCQRKARRVSSQDLFLLPFARSSHSRPTWQVVSSTLPLLSTQSSATDCWRVALVRPHTNI